MVIIFVSLFGSVQPSYEQKDDDYRLEEVEGLKKLCSTVGDLSLAESAQFFSSNDYALIDQQIKKLEQRVTDLRLSTMSQTSKALHFQSLKGSCFRIPTCRKNEIEIAAIEQEIKRVDIERHVTPLFSCEHAFNTRRMNAIKEAFNFCKDSRESQIAENVYKILSSSRSVQRNNRKK